MTFKLFFIFLLCCSFCEGQSVLTTPEDQTRSVQNPGTSITGGNTPFQSNQVPMRQTGGYPAFDPYASSYYAAPSYMEPYSARRRFVGPLRTKSEFQKFAEDATGHLLPVHGRRLFDEVPTTFSPVEHVPVPANYMLGPGDELLIRAWGSIDLDSRVTVDRTGQVYLPRVGTLNVAGLRYDQVEGYLHSAISVLFKDFSLNVSLGQLRSIQIFVLGSARQPGAYTVSSLSTLVNALFASGGPSATGSMRRIQLRRADKVISEFDIYDLVEKGDKSHDVQLLPGDVIYIPPVGPQVALSGSVNEPGIYELKAETSVSAVLDGAGGLTSLAGANRVLVERIDNHTDRTVEEFALDTAGLQRLLKDGDLLRIFPVSPKFGNAVTLRGNVAQAGRYVWKKGMRVSDLIPDRDFLVTRNFWNRQNHVVPRGSDREFASPRVDQYGRTIPDVADYRDDRRQQDPRAETNGQNDGTQMGPPYPSSQRSDQSSSDQYDDYDQNGRSQNDRLDAQPAGQVQRPGDQQRPVDETQRTPLIDTVGRNSAEINWEYAVIERIDEHDLSTRLIPFRLASAIDNAASTDNQLLMAGDVVTIFSRADLDLPMEKHASFVRVGGEVNAPGVYRVEPGETLKQIVEQAGGLTPHSYLYASLFTRVSTRKAQEEQLRRSAEEMQRELSSRVANTPPQAGLGAAEQQAQLALQQASLTRLTSIKPTGRVVLAMKPDAATTADIPDFSLEDGDAFYVPPRLSTVQVAGAVYNANAFRHEPGKRLIAYLNEAGGWTRQADHKRMFVIRADGTVVSSQSRTAHNHGNFSNLKLLPGDDIVVPERLRLTSKVAEILQATQFVSQLALTSAALSVATSR